MAQVQKAEVRARLLEAGREAFFAQGYDGTTMADIARRAGVATANIYRYVPDKEALFEAVLPDELLAEHDRLLDERIEALASPAAGDGAAQDLLQFWIQHRREIATLLDHHGTTSRATYPRAFVARLVAHVESTIPQPLDDAGRVLLELVFDNTRRAVVAILRSTADPAEIRRRIAGFWSYQLPGLDGLVTWLGAEDPSEPG